MSNLGTYQTITRLSKAVGGPKIFMGMLVGAGATVGSLATAFIILARSKHKKEIKNSISDIKNNNIYETIIADESNEEILFNVGDKIEVLEVDGDAVLINKIGDKNSPYYVAIDFLEKISDFKKGDK